MRNEKQVWLPMAADTAASGRTFLSVSRIEHSHNDSISSEERRKEQTKGVLHTRILCTHQAFEKPIP